MLTPKENYLTMLSGQIPEYVPGPYEQRKAMFTEDFLTPGSAPDGPIITALGIKYVGSADNNNGAMPDPYRKVLEDVTQWRDFVHTPDLSGFDFEKYYADKTKDIDRENQFISVTGGDYFLTLVSIMGFENALLALYEEPEEVKALLEYVSDFYIDIFKKQIYYAKPEVCSIMDDDSAQKNPFFSVAIYQDIFKPLHKKHCDLAQENGMYVERHDCGRSEQFIPDWIDLGIKSWNPAQTSNDLKGIKKKYGNKIAICGGWNALEWNNSRSEEELMAALKDYVDTLAPGGGFSFMASVSGDKDDPETERRKNLIKDFYFDYVHDYYKNH